MAVSYTSPRDVYRKRPFSFIVRSPFMNIERRALLFYQRRTELRGEHCRSQRVAHAFLDASRQPEASIPAEHVNVLVHERRALRHRMNAASDLDTPLFRAPSA